MDSYKTEQIKKILISEQQSDPVENQLVDAIIAGKVELLSDVDICKKLNLSVPEFTRLVRQSDPSYRADLPHFPEHAIRAFSVSQSTKLTLPYKQTFSFPKPDIYIAGKARWTTDTLKNWLLQGAK